MDRTIPENFDHRIIRSVFDEAGIKPRTEENYIRSLELIESEWENYLKDILGKLNVNASVKPDKYSLPYKEEIVFRKYESSIFPKAYYAFIFAMRAFVKGILERNLLKVRFYLLIELNPGAPKKTALSSLDTAELIVSFRFYGS